MWNIQIKPLQTGRDTDLQQKQRKMNFPKRFDKTLRSGEGSSSDEDLVFIVLSKKKK